MVFSGDPPRRLAPAGPARAIAPEIREVANGALGPTRIEAAAEVRSDPRVGRELVSRDRLIAASVAVRSFAAINDGRIAARCQLYHEGDMAQVENVYTSPRDRRQGYSRAVVGHAVSVARASGARVIFLVADAAGWPQDFYRRIGFEDAGLLSRFRCLSRDPGGAGSADVRLLTQKVRPPVAATEE